MLKFPFCIMFVLIITLSFTEEYHPFRINENFKLYDDVEQYRDFNRYTKLNPTFSTSEKAFEIVLGSLIITSFLFDQSIRNYFQDEIYGGSNIFTEILKGAGDKDVLFYFFLFERHTNLMLQDEYTNETLLLSIQSMITTQVITELSKKLTGRQRPRHSPNNPFNFWQGGASFFSGHSSGAWSHLTVVATRHKSMRVFAYGFAATVSLSRIYEDAHWTSDILTGALVGYTLGRLTVKYSSQKIKNIVIIPYLNSDEKCVLIQYQF